MAFAARLGALTGELVEAITLRSAETNLERFKAQREATLRTLRPNQYLRTNQFEVEHQLDGLEERFRVNGREALADALHERRGTLLETPSNFHPEILFLLLELSDQPTYYSKLSDLDLLKTGEDDAGLQLRWEDIAKEDGWEKDAAIWKSIKYSDSSDDEIYEDDSKSESEASTDPSEVQVLGRTAEDLIIHSEDIVQLNQIREAQEWRHEKPTDAYGHARKVSVTEFHIAREVLFMLQGLDTTLFRENGAANPAFQMAHLVWDTHRALISYFSEAGRQLAVLRSFIERPQRASHLQVFQDTVAMRLRDLDRRLTNIEAKLVAPKEDAIVSLLAIKRDLVSDLEPLYSLSSIIAQIQDVPNLGTFRYLELLFDEASMAQLSGKLDIYEFLARIFVECFNVYLRPIRLWMEEGKLIPGDKIFFVSEAPSQVSPSKIWREQFRLRRSADRKLHAPKFLQPAAAKIFNAGKNIVILKRLGRWVSTSSEWTVQEPPLDYETLCPKGLDLAPFSVLFDAAFDGWIQTKYNTTSTTLRNALFEECGLWSALDAMEHLYFMSDGSATEHWTSHLFDKLDTLNTGWHNRYSLTSVAQEAFTSLVDMTRVSVNVTPGGLRIPVLSARDSVKAALPTIRVNYRLAWPIRMILTEDSNAHYDAIFALLLQLKRALYVLHKRKLLECYWTDGENWDEEAFYYSLRNNLLWFCTTLQTYLATLVLAPNCAKMRQEMRGAHDVDAMIAVHAAFMKQVVDEACLGSRLTPIRECFLDILDLAIKLEQAQTANAAKEAQRMQHVSRLSARDLSPTPGTPGLKSRYVDSSDSDLDEPRGRPRRGKPFMAALKEIKADFDRHLRFVCGGLRSVARAASDVQSAKWDILAEMLQTGCREEKMGFS
ncbi:Spindle pole body component [Fusarium falciforme]|uniref:Spindle pole body component n=1 Tax=Fusarium falciforme TaxID=195108 RepID=UPI00230166AE|nr:Spindle pole body component [Fusarium falciforme]WAO93756.1 Spindle pole body component [Fusarium falciforme]